MLSILSPYFLTWSNFINVMRQAALQFLMAAGLTLVVLTGRHRSRGRRRARARGLPVRFADQPRLSRARASPPRSSAGLACGTVNGMLVTYGRIPPFIATYGMLWIAHGLGYVFMKGEVIYGLPEGFRLIGAGFVWGIPVPVLIAAGTCWSCCTFMLHATVLGRAIYAIGGNPIAARLSGMPVHSTT